AADEQPLLDRDNPEHLVLELARRGPCARAVVGAERQQTVPGGEKIHAVLLADCRVAVFGQRQLRATQPRAAPQDATRPRVQTNRPIGADVRSEEHTSELQSRFDLVCRLLLEKKKNKLNIV